MPCYLLDTQEVTGSSPVSPSILSPCDTRSYARSALHSRLQKYARMSPQCQDLDISQYVLISFRQCVLNQVRRRPARHFSRQRDPGHLPLVVMGPTVSCQGPSQGFGTVGDGIRLFAVLMSAKVMAPSPLQSLRASLGAGPQQSPLIRARSAKVTVPSLFASPT